MKLLVIRCGEKKLTTDLYVKPTDSHQYLHASSCHVFHAKAYIPYSQACQLNKICSEGSFFDKRCNELESWLMWVCSLKGQLMRGFLKVILLKQRSVRRLTCLSTLVVRYYRDNCEKRRCSGSHKQCKSLLRDHVVRFKIISLYIYKDLKLHRNNESLGDYREDGNLVPSFQCGFSFEAAFQL